MMANKSWCLIRSYGFTLVELMVVIAILGIAAAAALPNFTQWMQDARTKTAAETLQNYIRLAQTEAVKNGERVDFFLTNGVPASNSAVSATGLNWGIRTVNNPAMIQSGELAQQGGGMVLNASSAIITFNAIGRLIGQATTVTYQIRNNGGVRRLVVQVSPAGAVRMCDPDKTLNAANPDGCGVFN